MSKYCLDSRSLRFFKNSSYICNLFVSYLFLELHKTVCTTSFTTGRITKSQPRMVFKADIYVSTETFQPSESFPLKASLTVGSLSLYERLTKLLWTALVHLFLALIYWLLTHKIWGCFRFFYSSRFIRCSWFRITNVDLKCLFMAIHVDGLCWIHLLLVCLARLLTRKWQMWFVKTSITSKINPSVHEQQFLRGERTQPTFLSSNFTGLPFTIVFFPESAPWVLQLSIPFINLPNIT